LGLIVAASRAVFHVNSLKAASRSEVALEAAAIEAQLYQASAAAEALALLARQNGGPVPNFPRVATELLASYPAVDAFALEPAGIVSDIAPRTGRERMIGLNVMNDPAHGPGAKAAAQKRGTVVSGPLLLPSAELGIVARVPVFQRTRDGRESLWGFVTASMKMSQAMLRARVGDLPGCGYNYICYVPASGPKHALTIASSGTVTTLDAAKRIRIPNGENNAEIALALAPRNGWTGAFGLEVLAVILFSGLVGLAINSLESRQSVESALSDANQQIARETAERQRAQNEMLALKDAAAATHAHRAEFEQSQAALKTAQQTIADLQTRLETAARTEKETAANVLTRLQQDQAAIADLHAHLDAATHSARESAEASARKIQELESASRQMAAKLAAATHYETRVGELTASLQQAEAEIAKLRERAPATVTPETVTTAEAEPTAVPEPSETAKPRSEKKRKHKAVAEIAEEVPAPEPITEPAPDPVAEPAPEPAPPAAPEATETPATTPAPETAPAKLESEATPAPATAADSPPIEEARQEFVVEATPAVAPETQAAAEPAPEPVPPDATEPSPVPAPEAKADVEATEKPAKPARKKKARRVDQMDLFGGSAPEEADAPQVVAETPEKSSPNETATLFEPAPAEAKSHDDAPEATPDGKEAGTTTQSAQTTPEPETDKATPADEAPETDVDADAGKPKSHAKTVRHFIHDFARMPEKIRDHLVQDDAAGAQELVHTLRNAAEQAGAHDVQTAAAELARAIQNQADSAKIEFVWADLQKSMDNISAEFKPAPKPKAEKPKPARALPAAPPVDAAELRAAVGMITPLLMDQDPGAKDCLKDNRDTFRSAFSPEGYVEFEDALKGDEYAAALEHLRKATRKHGISI
jgi:HPt (histidine-containing phosphotransfer) domain-containing protein